MALKAGVSPSSAALLQQLQDLLNPGGHDPGGNDVKSIRKEACTLAEKLWIDLVEPGDFIDRVISQPQENALTRLAMNMGIYSTLVQAFPESRTAGALATIANADEVLTVRIMRCLAALHHVTETETNRGSVGYTANKITRAWTTDKGVGGLIISYDITTPASRAMPAFFAASNYRNPTDPRKAPLQHAFNTDKHFFDLITERNLMPMFQTVMTAWRADRADFLDIYPAEERLHADFDPDDRSRSFFVDVGGGLGHEIRKVRGKFLDVAGESFVLQEQRGIIEQVNADPENAGGIKVMAYDFFMPQTVQGARCYYFRMIFHDCPS